ncbi:MAG: Pyridoxamine 5-phosphate oxidase [Actinomycetia bacterium]|nr:Pyridoxamine 5-phosphate oxidase [Actinomycetes bacterium]
MTAASDDAPELDGDHLDPDPIRQFEQWFAQARDAGVRQPEAMTLATVTAAGRPAARTVLLRGLDQRGFVFYTNLESAKAHDLAQQPHAALVFHWREVERQVRVVGPVSVVDRDKAVRYWETRPRGHRIGAWASPQSEVVAGRDELDRRVADVERRFAGVDPPLPRFWGGYRVAPVELELWQGRKDRLHDRARYRRVDDFDDNASWIIERLAP